MQKIKNEELLTQVKTQSEQKNMC